MRRVAAARIAREVDMMEERGSDSRIHETETNLAIIRTHRQYDRVRFAAPWSIVAGDHRIAFVHRIRERCALCTHTSNDVARVDAYGVGVCGMESIEFSRTNGKRNC